MCKLSIPGCFSPPTQPRYEARSSHSNACSVVLRSWSWATYISWDLRWSCSLLWSAMLNWASSTAYSAAMEIWCACSLWGPQGTKSVAYIWHNMQGRDCNTTANPQLSNVHKSLLLCYITTLPTPPPQLPSLHFATFGSYANISDSIVQHKTEDDPHDQICYISWPKSSFVGISQRYGGISGAWCRKSWCRTHIL